MKKKHISSTSPPTFIEISSHSKNTYKLQLQQQQQQNETLNSILFYSIRNNLPFLI